MIIWLVKTVFIRLFINLLILNSMVDFDVEEHKYKLLEYQTLGVHISQLDGYAKFVLENTNWSLFHPDMYDVMWRLRESIIKARMELANNINFLPAF